MANMLLAYLKFTIELLNHFSAKNLFLIYSSVNLNSANLKTFTREIQNNYLVTSYYYDVNINRNNITQIILGDDFNLNSSHVFMSPLFLVYLFDDDLYNFNFRLANDLSSSKWLIIMNESAEIDVHKLFGEINNRPDFGSEVFFVRPFNEFTKIEISEIYYKNIKVDEYVFRPYATWDTNDNRLHAVQHDSIFRRRKDLSNLTLTVSTLGNYPITVLLSADNSKILGGYFGNTWTALEKHLKFKTVVIIPHENTWGKPDAQGHWDGIIGQVMYNEADVALMDLLMIPERRAVVHFFEAIVSTRQLIIIKQEETDYIQWLSFLRPLSYGIWLCLLTLVVGLPIFMLLFNINNTEKKNFTECCLETLQIICQQSGIRRFPNSSAGYVFYTFLFYVGYIILIGYSAALISFLTIVIFIFPFNKIADIYQTSYNLLMYAGSGLLSTIMRSTDKIYQYIIKYQFDPTNLPSGRYEDALDMVCNSTRKRYALYAQKYPIEYVLINYQQNIQTHCSLVSKTAGTTFKLSFAGSYQSPYIDLMNFCLIRFKEYGIINCLRKYEQPQKLINIYKEVKSVKITSVFPMFLILIVGIVLSLLIFIIEIIYSRRVHRKCMRQKRTPQLRYLN